MEKDEVKGRMKDVDGRIERQTGEWICNTRSQARGGARQAEGKLQNATGK